MPRTHSLTIDLTALIFLAWFLYSGVFIGIPLDFVKTRTQLFPTMYKGPMDCAVQTLKSEGVTGFYKGMWSPLAAQFFVNALAFAGESITMRYFNQFDPTHERCSTLVKGSVAGGVAGLLTCLATVPTDLIKVRMQGDAFGTPKYKNTFQCVRDTFRKEGFTGFYKGMGVTIVREIPSFAAYFVAYAQTIKYLTPPGEQPVTSSILMAGGAAGMASWVPVYPLDVIKTYIQSNPQDKRGMLSVAAGLLKDYGPKVFFRGIGPVILRALPVNGATFYVYEDVKTRMGLNKYVDLEQINK